MSVRIFTAADHQFYGSSKIIKTRPSPRPDQEDWQVDAKLCKAPVIEVTTNKNGNCLKLWRGSVGKNAFFFVFSNWICKNSILHPVINFYCDSKLLLEMESNAPPPQKSTKAAVRKTLGFSNILINNISIFK